MGDASARRFLGLQKFTKVSHRVFTLLFGLWNRGNEPSRSDDSLFKNYADEKEKKGEGGLYGRDLERLDEKREEAQEHSCRYRQRMTEANGRMTKERVFAEGKFVLKATDHVRRGMIGPFKFSPKWKGPLL